MLRKLSFFTWRASFKTFYRVLVFCTSTSTTSYNVTVARMCCPTQMNSINPSMIVQSHELKPLKLRKMAVAGLVGPIVVKVLQMGYEQPFVFILNPHIHQKLWQGDGPRIWGGRMSQQASHIGSNISTTGNSLLEGTCVTACGSCCCQSTCWGTSLS